MINVDKLNIQTIDQITCFNNANELEFIMDEIQNGTISNTQEKSDLTGKGGRKIGSLKKNKGVTVSATNGYIVGGALAVQVGTDVEYGKFKVRISDIITVNTNKGKSTSKAVGTVGNEIGTVYLKNTDGTLGKKFTQDVVAATEGKFTYKPDTGEIEFYDSDVPNGSEIVAFYDVEVEAAKITNDSEKYSKTLKMYMDVTVNDACDNLYHGQFIIPRADFNGEFNLEMGSDPAVHNIEAESLVNSCSGTAGKLWEFIVFEDVPEIEGE